MGRCSIKKKNKQNNKFLKAIAGKLCWFENVDQWLTEIFLYEHIPLIFIARNKFIQRIWWDERLSMISLRRYSIVPPRERNFNRRKLTETTFATSTQGSFCTSLNLMSKPWCVKNVINRKNNASKRMKRSFYYRFLSYLLKVKLVNFGS